MARKSTLKPAEQIGPDYVGATPADMAEQETRVRTMNAETADNAQALAVQFGYEGSLTVGAVEDEIRHYQRRTAEACFELGKRLLILKELTPHGEFKQRLDLLGIEYASANRFMAISRKFSNVATSQLLKAGGTQYKMLELLVLDDSEIEELEAGETVRGLDLDKIETMSVRELKAALREAHEDAKATDKVLGNVTGQKHALEKELEKTKRRVESATPDEVAEELRRTATVEAFAAEAAVTGNLRNVVQALISHGQANNQQHEDFIVGLLCQIEASISGLRGEFQLKQNPDGDDMPEWMRDGFDAKAAAAGKAN